MERRDRVYWDKKKELLAKFNSTEFKNEYIINQMRSISPKLTNKLNDHFRVKEKGTENILEKIATSDPFKISTYAELIKIVADLSFLNQDYLLYFRGQRTDYKNKRNGKSTFFPEIYRDTLSKEKLENKLMVLENASILLKHYFEKKQIFGFKTLGRF